MKYPFLVMAGRIGCAGVLGAACLAGAAAAQQPAPKKAPAVAPADQGGQQADIVPVGWVKLCRKYTATSTNKDGKEQNQDLNICLTKNETIYVNSGKVLSSAAIRQINGEPKQHLMVTVPLGMDLRPGMRATVFPKDIWEKSQKGGQVNKADEAKLKPLTLVYTQCHPDGCDGELEVTPQLINDFMTGGALMLFAFNTAGAPVPFPVPLAGFDKAYAGAPMEDQSYNEGRRKLMRQIEQQQEIRGTIVVPKQLRP
jgi:invasion protein IalB